MTTSIGGTTGVTFPDASVQNTAATGFGFKNRIINGAMMIDQRNAGASVTAVSSGYLFPVDRFSVYGTQNSKFTAQQNAGSVTLPTGYINYLGITSSSAYSVLSTDLFILRQTIEGLNVADLNWGTANAATVTLSFWVRSSLTGTFGGSLRNADATRSYPFSFTISSANTWEQKSVTIAGDTSGTWLATNGTGIALFWGLGVGSNQSGTAGAWASADYRSCTGATSVVGTNGATFYITGVQLEKGSTATSFDYRPYGTELALCQRYYEKSFDMGTAPADGVYSIYTLIGSSNNSGGNSFFECWVPFKVQKRTAPNMTYYGSSGTWQYSNTGTWTTFGASPFTQTGVAREQGVNIQMGSISGTGDLYKIRMARGDWAAAAEL